MVRWEFRNETDSMKFWVTIPDNFDNRLDWLEENIQEFKFVALLHNKSINYNGRHEFDLKKIIEFESEECVVLYRLKYGFAIDNI